MHGDSQFKIDGSGAWHLPQTLWVAQLDDPPWTVADLGAGTMMEPRAQARLQLGVARIRVLAPQLLAHDLDPGLEEIARRLQNLRTPIVCGRASNDRA